ncbi:nitroreductase family protein [Clostridium rectalis]|uniref:nitroreductase family protein n=1 Tax=Clostridium rectalis TaxID=2040295 RepID=UPI000F641B00|nr:nitroreductase family protein [Clostridium rectalis]
MDLIDAISNRHSVREYENEQVNLDTLEKIEKKISKAERLFKDIDMNVHIVKDGEKVFKILNGIISNYGKVKAPHYLVITSEKKHGYLENIGFTLEGIVLELTSMGLGSCWIGSGLKENLLNTIIKIPLNNEPIIVIAFGYEKSNKMRKNYHKRKNIIEFASGDFQGGWIDILELVRKAPSSMNFQPWRIFKENDIINLYSIKRKFIAKKLEDLNKIDCGIAASHLLLGAKSFNMDIELKKLFGKNKENLNYIISAIET